MGLLQGGATFTVTPNPVTGDATALIVVDNGPEDMDPTDGQFRIANARIGTYTVTETIAPTGYARDNDGRFGRVAFGRPLLDTRLVSRERERRVLLLGVALLARALE